MLRQLQWTLSCPSQSCQRCPHPLLSWVASWWADRNQYLCLSVPEPMPMPMPVPTRCTTSHKPLCPSAEGRYNEVWHLQATVLINGWPLSTPPCQMPASATRPGWAPLWAPFSKLPVLKGCPCPQTQGTLSCSCPSALLVSFLNWHTYRCQPQISMTPCNVHKGNLGEVSRTSSRCISRSCPAGFACVQECLVTFERQFCGEVDYFGLLEFWMTKITPHCVCTQGITDDNFAMITMVTKRSWANCHVKSCKNKMRLLRTLSPSAEKTRRFYYTDLWKARTVYLLIKPCSFPLRA